MTAAGSIGVTILGATGSVGLSTLDVLRRHRGAFHVDALTARRNVGRMRDLCRQVNPRAVVMVEPDAAEQLASQLVVDGLSGVEVLAGAEALEQVAAAASSQYVMAAIVGAAGLLPTLAAARSGKRVLLANKEALVMSGPLFMREVDRSGAELLPIDSEHNAVFQCLPSRYRGGLGKAGIERILLTASGGPFLDTPLDRLSGVTPAQACRHPNWDMGRKISVDSATMMNKGLEMIEACWLFDARPEQVEVVVHPQSVVHSMVSYCDGSVLAQLGNPDMRIPIAHALAWPRRIDSGVRALDLVEVGRLEFRKPDPIRFPCLDLAAQALAQGGTAATALNAANEVAVQGFLDEQLAFTAIPELISEVMQQTELLPADDLDKVLETDFLARRCAKGHLQRLSAEGTV